MAPARNPLLLKTLIDSYHRAAGPGQPMRLSHDLRENSSVDHELQVCVALVLLPSQPEEDLDRYLKSRMHELLPPEEREAARIQHEKGIIAAAREAIGKQFWPPAPKPRDRKRPGVRRQP